MTIGELRARWHDAWGKVAAIGTGEEIFASLITRYAEPHRAYHNIDHIRDCLRWVDQVRQEVDRVGETELAIWFHDAIYEPRRSDNEEQSAQWAERSLDAAGAAADRVEHIGQLIRLTTHKSPRLFGDAAILCDIDLAILGAETSQFDAYDAAIRVEYGWVPEDTFRRGRGEILSGFLARPRIYHSRFFYDLLEEPARANLQRTLARYST